MSEARTIPLTTRQIEALRTLQERARAAQSEVTIYMSAILHGIDTPPDAAWSLNDSGTALVRHDSNSCKSS